MVGGVIGGGRAEPAPLLSAAPNMLADCFGAAVERWIEGTIRGGRLEPHLLDLREALPQLYEELVTGFFAAPGTSG